MINEVCRWWRWELEFLKYPSDGKSKVTPSVESMQVMV